MMKQKVLVSEDLSCLGQVSMSVALPILGAIGLQPVVLPTALLSTHSGGFGQNTYLDLNREMKKIANHWQKLKLSFTGLYFGYLGTGGLDFWYRRFSYFQRSNQIRLLDPAMADDNHFYSGLNKGYLIKMRSLVKKATVVTPNWTEANLLLNGAFPQQRPTTEQITQLAEQLKIKFSLPNILITGIPIVDNKIMTVGLDDKSNLWLITQKRLAGPAFGNGDLFASALMVELMKGKTLKKASKRATAFVEKSILATSSNQDKRLGPNYAPVLPWLLQW